MTESTATEAAADLRTVGTNRVHIEGRLTRKPELRMSAAGTPWCIVGIGTTFRGQSVFHDVAAFGAVAVAAAEGEKGQRVRVDGHLSYGERDGVRTCRPVAGRVIFPAERQNREP